MLRRVIVLMLVVVSAAPALAQQPIDLNTNLSVLWDHLRDHPEDFSAACMPLDAPGSMVLYNATERFPLASVTKLLIFIEYAQRVDAGAISATEMVDLDVLNHYDLTRTDASAHRRFLNLYPAETQAISLLDIAYTGMMQYSSNAAADYVLDRLRPVDWVSLYEALNITSTDYPHSLSVIALLMNNHETGETTLEDIPSLSVAQGEALYDRYLYDLAWRAAEIAYREERRRAFPQWEVQSAVLQDVTATGTVSDFLNVMAAIYGQGGPLSESVKAMTRAALRWRNNDLLDSNYIEYGSKLGFYSGGTLALVAYGLPYGGQPVISAAFMRNIPRQEYNTMRRQDSIGFLAHWMNFNACDELLDTIQSPPVIEPDDESG